MSNKKNHANLVAMNEATLLEQTTAVLLIAQAVDVMEQHCDPRDLDASLQAVFVRALEVLSNRPLKPIEELFNDR